MPKQEPKLKTLYVCTKLSIITPNSNQYFTPQYYDVASHGLNTGEEKHFFFNKEQALAMLYKKGTIWCVYQVDVPKDKFFTDPESGKIKLNNAYAFTADNIKDTIFHPTFTFDKGNAPTLDEK